MAYVSAAPETLSTAAVAVAGVGSAISDAKGRGRDSFDNRRGRRGRG